MCADDVRIRVAEWTDSEAAGFVAAGAILAVKFVVACGHEVRRELDGLRRAIARKRTAVRAATDGRRVP